LFKWKEQIEFPPVEGRGPLEFMSSGKSFCCCACTMNIFLIILIYLCMQIA